MQQGPYVWSLLLGGVLLWGLVVAPAVHAQSSRPSPADCDAYARNYANNAGAPVLGGAARGAAGGAMFGAIIGGGKGAGRGAALGAGIGAVGGGIRKSEIQNRAYNDCMAGRVRW